MTNQCQHGQLARVCEMCELQKQVAALTAERDEAREEVAQKSDNPITDMKERK